VVAGSSAGPAADVYGLMLCVYLMLSGNRFAFDVAPDAPVAQWLKAHTDAPVIPITVFNSEVPPSVAALLGRGLAKDPAQRPSAAEVAAAFEGREFATAGKARRAWGGGVWLGAGAAVVLLAGAVMLLREPAPQSAAPAASTPSPEASVSPTPVAPESLAPPSTRPPRAERPTAAPAPPLKASFHGELLTLSNTGPDPLLDLRIVLIDPAGVRHNAAAPDGIAAGEELHLAVDDFTPAIDPAAVPRRLEVSARDPRRGRSTFSVGLR
jgi:hypothetical protein